ncbi:hypothetical protein BMS3Bbin10_02372 [bacterium BMS3Bbin10]|nr:hypothetical protein BMS3Bbin10_02372 [bacterium BMS3Bbin10]
MPLTGGYRRTPVMRIGADIYCDSQCILREIDRRHVEPTFFPGGGFGLPWAISRWTDAILFDLVVRVALGSAPGDLPGEALEIARMAEPETKEKADPLDPQGLAPGMTVSVTPDGDGGDPEVGGIVRMVTRDTIAILRDDEQVGSVCVHFPRVGYRVSAI